MNNNPPKKVIVSVTSDLATDNRVNKICSSLFKNGYNILLIGRQLKYSCKIDTIYTTHRLKLIFNKKIFFYAEYNFRLFLFLLFKKADILLSNDLDTLLANYLIAKIKNIELIYDSHEYYTALPELINRPKIRKIWLFIEKKILPKIRKSYTVCDSIANIYNKKYSINMQTIRNLPLKNKICHDNLEIINKLKTFRQQHKNIVIYQGSINVGRGIDKMIDAMEFLPNTIFIIVGGGYEFEKNKKYIDTKKYNDRFYMTNQIPYNQLYSITKMADVGISIEENLAENYYYALPNKLFDYIQAKIPVLISNLPEMKNIVEKYNVGEVIENHSADEIAKKIKYILSRKSFYAENLEYAANELTWEKEEKILLGIFGAYQALNQ